MEVIDFLKRKLEHLANQFPNVTVKYKFDQQIYRHIVELTPQDVYYNDTNLDRAWIDISLEFMNSFSDETISFISEDSTLKIDNPTLIFNEKKFESLDIEMLFTTILNSTLDIDYIKYFESISYQQVITNNFHSGCSISSINYGRINYDLLLRKQPVESTIENQFAQAA